MLYTNQTYLLAPTRHISAFTRRTKLRALPTFAFRQDRFIGLRKVHIFDLILKRFAGSVVQNPKFLPLIFCQTIYCLNCQFGWAECFLNYGKCNEDMTITLQVFLQCMSSITISHLSCCFSFSKHWRHILGSDFGVCATVCVCPGVSAFLPRSDCSLANIKL